MTEKVDFDQYTDNYNELLREGTKFFSSNEEYFARYKIELVRKYAHQPVGRILEYGCGIGRNISYLKTAFPGAEVIGTDISEAGLALAAKENPGVRFEVERAGLDVGTFDLIFVAGVFHHVAVAERAGVSQVLHDRLNPKGSLFVFEHNPYNPVTRRIVDTCPYDADAVLLRPSELKALLCGTGLKSDRRAYCLFVPPKLSWLMPLENWLQWLPMGGQYWVSAHKA
ncbi:class I SAM-dependent methyltransferase [Rhodoferax sp.]|uniref:class I SAM-dependent methyltransferase n=1 Tax=Rhodoferax sp. TaxID=50421 RepID=UPI00374D960D